MPPREIEIRGETIRLGQLLKLSGVAQDGGEAKALLQAGEVRVGGEPETRRGRRVRRGERVSAAGDELLIV